MKTKATSPLSGAAKVAVASGCVLVLWGYSQPQLEPTLAPPENEVSVLVNDPAPRREPQSKAANRQDADAGPVWSDRYAETMTLAIRTNRLVVRVASPATGDCDPCKLLKAEMVPHLENELSPRWLAVYSEVGKPWASKHIGEKPVYPYVWLIDPDQEPGVSGEINPRILHSGPVSSPDELLKLMESHK